MGLSATRGWSSALSRSASFPSKIIKHCCFIDSVQRCVGSISENDIIQNKKRQGSATFQTSLSEQHHCHAGSD